MHNTEALSKLDFKVVAARYAEDVEWLSPYAPKVVIVNKGELPTIPEHLREYTVEVPNLGLDQYCILHYIVSNYDNLPEIIVFTQANLDEHRDVHEPTLSVANLKQVNTIHSYTNTLTAQQIIYEMIKQVHIYGTTHNAKTYIIQDIALAYPGLKVDTQDEYSTDLTLGEWFKENLEVDMPDPGSFYWFKNAIFGVAKRYVLSRPKAFYEKLLNQITMPRQDILHYIERSWYYILNMDKDVSANSTLSTVINHQHIFKTLDRIVVESGQGFVEGSLFFFGNQDMQYNEVFMHKQVNLFNLAKKAKNILEIGFNAGHSTALMLLANPSSKILHFDLREHAYGERCYNFLKSVFGADRFIEFVAGDSRETVPVIHERCPIKFDLIHIDGGHTDLVAYSDIVHCQKYAAKDNIVVVDDYNMENIKSITDQFVRRGTILPQTTVVTEEYCGQSYHYIGHYAV
jgi:hypothetical protein